MDTCICMAESVHHSPETITTLLIGYTPIQNAFGVLKKIKKNNNNKKYLHKKKTCDMLQKNDKSRRKGERSTGGGGEEQGII